MSETVEEAHITTVPSGAKRGKFAVFEAKNGADDRS